MGFPYDKAEWVAGLEAIFPGAGGSMPGLYSLIGIIICIAALAVGQRAEARKYNKYK